MSARNSMSFTSFLGIRHPIVLAPMAGTVTPELAAAVSNAGGLGSLGIGSSSVDAAREMIDKTRELTAKPFNINLFCHPTPARDPRVESEWLQYISPLFAEIDAQPPDSLGEPPKSFLIYPEMLSMLLETKPAVISFHFGLPDADTIAAIKAAGIITFATATNLDDARIIQAAGIDAIVAQGVEAGGHRGTFNPAAPDQRLPTSVLVRELASELDLPIIAAGGIMDGQGIRSALNLGAAAVQMGTAFILCPESAASQSYRANLKSERARNTRLTSVVSGRPARALVNRYIEYGEAPGSPVPPAYPLPYEINRKLSAEAPTDGTMDIVPHWAGQGAPSAREMPASELMDLLVQEMEQPS